MSTSTRIIEEYMKAVSTNIHYENNEARWQFYLESYMGGEEYKRGRHLTRYMYETESEYLARIDATPLDNHCRSVISVYTSFLFREEPDREYGSIEYDPMLKDFLEDADMDGRSFDVFMKDVAIWSAVFGHSWVMVTKPNVGAVTRADEIAMGIRPYVSVLTPLAVLDWEWKRNPIGRYELSYFKYVEDYNSSIQVIKIWTPETISTVTVDNFRKEITGEETVPNMMGKIPAVICYSTRSPVRGLGASAISDIADHQKKIYNELSEVEQSIRLNGHPALVKTPDVEAVGGAGAIIQMPENLDSGLKPYLLSVATNTDSIYNSIRASVDAIDKMANTGAVRTTEVREMSGIAMRTEFELLNAKLAEMADNLENCEEGIWKLYCEYQATMWDGEIEYPGSFNIQDTDNDIRTLQIAKTAATDPRVLQLIDHELVEALGEESDLVLGPEPYLPADQLPEKKAFEPHYMINPETGEKFIARTEQEHMDYAAMGYVHKEGY